MSVHWRYPPGSVLVSHCLSVWFWREDENGSSYWVARPDSLQRLWSVQLSGRARRVVYARHQRCRGILWENSSSYPIAQICLPEQHFWRIDQEKYRTLLFPEGCIPHPKILQPILWAKSWVSNTQYSALRSKEMELSHPVPVAISATLNTFSFGIRGSRTCPSLIALMDLLCWSSLGYIRTHVYCELGYFLGCTPVSLFLVSSTKQVEFLVWWYHLDCSNFSSRQFSGGGRPFYRRSFHFQCE